MTKLYFNNSDLKQSVIPSLTNTIDRINSSISIANSMSVPGGFKYAGYLNNLDFTLKGYRNNLIYTNEWLYTSNVNLNNCCKEIDSNLNLVMDMEINIRKKLVN